MPLNYIGPAPSAVTDVATKEYVDAVGYKLVVAATTANITLSNTQTIDGVSVTAGQRVLVKNQTTTADNGVYDVVSGGAWTRSTDFNTATEAAGALVGVQRGTVNGGKLFANTFTAGSTLGVTTMPWTLLDPSATATHAALSSGAHTASAISIVDTPNKYTATDVEAALTEVKTLADAFVGSTLGVNYVLTRNMFTS